MTLDPVAAAASVLAMALGLSSSAFSAVPSAREDASAARQYEALKISRDPHAATAGEYRLDPHHASLLAKMSHMDMANYTLRFNAITGQFDFNPAGGMASNLRISIDPASVDTGDAKFDTKIAAKYFEAGRYPAITFTAAATKVASGHFPIAGMLDFHGVQRPLVIKATYHGFTGLDGQPRMGFSGEASFRRSDFGVGQWVPLEADEVTLVIETEFLLHKDGGN